MNRFTRFYRLAVVPAALFKLLAPSIRAQGGAGNQVQTTSFGSSGSNVKDLSTYYCCGGTLGSLVTAGGINYILSNNHVLAREGQAAIGEQICQPGLIDNACKIPTNIVGKLTAAVALGGTNVDAAIAQLTTGKMDGTGTILGIGVPSSVVRTPSIGLAVAKSGRTTGLTTGNISSVNTSVTVQYQKGCGVGQLFNVSYTNQVIITSTTFSAAGDSGSLIVTNNSCHQPVALLFAGNSSATVGNPVSAVLSKIGSTLKKTVTFVGTPCTATATSEASTSPAGAPPNWPSQEAVDLATEAMNQRLDNLMSLPGVIGVGIGASDTNSSEAVIVIYVDATSKIMPELPKRVNDVNVKVIYTDPFIAY